MDRATFHAPSILGSPAGEIDWRHKPDGIVDRKEWPDYLQTDSLKGIHIGSCISNGRAFRSKAHAHITDCGGRDGWVCILSTRWLWGRHGRLLLLHELAHILADCGHTDKWRAKVLEIGGTLDRVITPRGVEVLKDYHKRTRKG